MKKNTKIVATPPSAEVATVSNGIAQALEAGRKKGMVQGIGLVCQIVLSESGDGSLVERILSACGLGLQEMLHNEVAEYDLEILLNAHVAENLVLKP